jgi:hypothetical protein
MRSVSFARSLAITLLLAVTLSSGIAAAQARPSSGGLAGRVISEDGRAVALATIEVRRTDNSTAATATSDSAGFFRVAGVAPGLYRMSVRRIGFREAQLNLLRVVTGQTSEVSVTLTASPTLLSSVEVRVTATSIDATTPELSRRIEVDDVKALPMGRDAGSLVDLLPGARRGYVWGGAGDAANNYQLDGVSVNHPGIGGDFLSPSIDWIEALEVRGLGAGAEHGGFQGGIINAVTRTGTNRWKGLVNSSYISPALTSSNVFPNEEGAEESMRRELSGVAQGPIVRDRLFYFVGGVLIDRRIQVPDIRTLEPVDVRDTEQEYRDLRGIMKLTLRPGPLDRIDAALGHTDNRVEHAALNGIDDDMASQTVRSPTTFYELQWQRSATAGSIQARLAGFQSRETRLGYAGDDVPGIQVFTRGRQPVFQNALFNDRVTPRSVSGNIQWSKEHAVGSGSNRIVAGGELTRGSWKKTRTRNGGLTWMPYVDPETLRFDPADAASWPDVASEWGGEIRIDSRIEDAALFIQDYYTIRPNLTITPGLRFGRWRGWLTPADGTSGRFLAVTDNAVDPRIGIVWDISGRNDLVMKGHWGRYHQAMSSLFFDRAEGGAAYTNERFYFQGPGLSDPRTVYTPAERDANLDTFFGFSPTFVETILNEAGKVDGYRQPFVDQIVASVEKRFGPRWKTAVSFTNRVNRDIVGLVDRNLAENYSPLENVLVRDRVFQTPIFDHNGAPLRLPVVWVSNLNLRNELITRRNSRLPRPPVAGYTFADIDRLTFDPDIVLTTVPDARRSMQQLIGTVVTEQETFSWSASATFTNLKGNVAGLTGFGTIGGDFTAGPGVRRNEQVNYEGRLPDFAAFDAKSWIIGDLPYGLRGGVTVSWTLGHYFAPSFRFTPRFAFADANQAALNDSVFLGALGQTILLEPRGSLKYPPVGNLDLRLEKRLVSRAFNAVVSADLFNAFGADAVILRNLNVNDGTSTDPTSVFGAARRRVAPMRLQVGLRIENQ